MTRKTPKAALKTVAYYRVSTQQQGRSGLGLAAQRETVRSFLEGRHGFPPVAEFTERESGKNIKRPQLAKALATCRAYGATLVIAKLDRLARNQAFLMSLVDSGVDVLFCDLPEIPAGAMGRFLIQSMAAVAELEAGLISERTKAALRAKVERDGQWDRKGTPNLVPGVGQRAAAEAVRQKADEFTADRLPLILIMQQEEGLSLHQIAASLNDQGVTTARGGKWYATTVRNALLRAA